MNGNEVQFEYDGDKLTMANSGIFNVRLVLESGRILHKRIICLR